MKKTLNGDTLFGIVVMLICAGFFGFSFQYRGMSGEAGPGMFPRIVAVATGLLALVLTINGMRSSTEKKAAGKREDRKIFAYTIILTALYLILWPYVHFIICTELFLLAMCGVLKLSKKFAVIYCTIFSVGIYYIFANVFHILL
ncbi:tripartite tricarboxylate transporter TctB family protein [Lachnospiraceae bacterium 62-35]